MSFLQSLDVGNYRMPCPACGRHEKEKTFGVTVEHFGGGVGHCFRCGHTEHYRPDGATHHEPGKAPVRPVAPPKRAALSEYGASLFAASVGLHGTIGEQYLSARGCAIPPADGDLRFHPALKHPSSDFTGPALVALVTDAATRAPLTLHRTWVQADGNKANCDPPRMLLGGHTKRHGVVRLWPDDCVTYGLAVAEGIETALSLEYEPAWSCIDAGNLAALPSLLGIETLVIAADHDDAGIASASQCADRWTRAGVDVRLIAPTARHTDWNDVRTAA